MLAASFLPKWQAEIVSFSGVKNLFVIEGNVRDKYALYDSEGKVGGFIDFDRTVNKLINDSRKYDIIYADPTYGGLYCYKNDMDKSDFEVLSNSIKTSDVVVNGKQLFVSKCSFETLCEITRTVFTSKTDKNSKSRMRPVALVINSLSHFITNDNGELNESEHCAFLDLIYAVRNSVLINGLKNILIISTDKLSDLPLWFINSSSSVRTAEITLPDRKTRAAFFRHELDDNYANTAEIEKAIDITSGMKLEEIAQIINMSCSDNIELNEAINVYRYGFKRSVWADVSDKLRGNPAEILKRRVKGQDKIIDEIIPMLKRAVTGMSGIHHSAKAQKPKGVFFMTGPTGTGKTELVKAISELLFGDENNIIRFDMSEYSQENADQKLFGAPPGYVGYREGGQLTNAVSANPFSIILFDEIEKASPAIMDKFLQILEDGRMTDGMGKTVSFAETMIFFTSNVGIVRMPDRNLADVSSKFEPEYIVTPDDDYETVIIPTVMDVIPSYFKPEVLNRIGNNIVVFNFIQPDTAREIVAQKLADISDILLKNKDITVEYANTLPYYEAAAVSRKEVTYMGGRGIINLLEKEFLNSLAECIFDEKCSDGDVVVADIIDNHPVFRKR